MIHVRHAQPPDVVALVAMGCRFIAESGYRGLVMPNAAAQHKLIGYLLEHGLVLVAETTEPAGALVGMALFSIFPLPITGELAASEVAWWVEPESRKTSAAGRLWYAAERWAKSRDAVWIQMIAPYAADDVARLYRRRGYVAVETMFQKRLAA